MGAFEKLGESDPECSSSMFRSSENKESRLRQDDCFQNKKREEIRHYGQALIKTDIALL